MSAREDIEQVWARRRQEKAREARLEAVALAVLFAAIGYLLALCVFLPLLGWFFAWATQPTITLSLVLSCAGAVGGGWFGYRLNR